MKWYSKNNTEGYVNKNTLPGKISSSSGDYCWLIILVNPGKDNRYWNL